MKIAYLVNQYPKVSHSFIRREIAGLESHGINIERFSIRSCEAELVDEADKAELERTRIVLDIGLIGLLFGTLRAIRVAPVKFWQALRLSWRIGWGSERGALRHLVYLAEACVLQHWFARGNITHIHAHFGTNSTTVAMLCGVLSGLPYSFTVHGPEEFDNVRGLALSEKIARAAFVVAISSFGKSQLSRWCSPADRAKIQIVRCGVDRSFFDLPAVPLPEAHQLVCIGRLSEQKGHFLLVEAAAQLAAEDLPFKLVLVGDGLLRAELEAEIARCGLQDRIEITGWASSETVQKYLLASRALVLPSFAEGLPVVIMEALALRRPVVSTYIAGIPELVEPGVCGWLVPAGSVGDLADAMRVVLQQSPAKLEEMGLAGMERIVKYHDASEETRRLAALFAR
jgi:colanic acid/amylovoran biosynthesis glycosyltransferase